jgi:hypothetical protein
MEQKHLGNRAPTVELNASVDGVEMYVYYIGGSCGARSFHGFNKGTPEQVIRGIAHSGCGGCVMYLIDVYEGGKKAEAFKKYVEDNDLGTVDVSRPSPGNPYTGSKHVTAVYGYQPSVVSAHAAKLEGKDSWLRPEGWYGTHDAIHMDSEFYQFGGRAKPADQVRLSGINKAQAAKSEAA